MRTDARSPSARGWKRLFRLPVFLLANAALLLLVGVSTLRESVRGWTVDREIQALESQAQALEGRKLKLMELTQSLSSPEQTELEARRRLGWKKEGERVIVLSGFAGSSSTTTEDPTRILSDDAVLQPSIGLWWEYFFGAKN